MEMAIHRGRPPKHDVAMTKTSIQLPDVLIERLDADAKKSGFRHWSEQLRYELMKPRGLWREIVPVLPTQGAPGKA